MDRLHPGYLAAVVCLSLLVLHLLLLRARRLAASMRAKRRARRAVRGELEAEALLSERGYRLLGRQLRETWIIEVGGEPTPIELRADLLVEREGLSYVAEVKTGDVAPLVTHAPTRRQLLEYLIAFDADGILLVEPEIGEVREVRFPGHKQGRPIERAALGTGE